MITSRKTKVLTVLFATLMIFALLTMLPVRTVHADSDPLLYTFNEEDHTAYVNWWANDTNPDVVVPEQVNGYTVTGIGENAFSSKRRLESITIPATVRQIGIRAFDGCTNLSKVTIRDGSQLEEIQAFAFNNCSNLKNINIPTALKTIDSNAFAHTKALNSINIPASVTTIGVRAFLDSGISSITFANDSELKSVGELAFENCGSLKKIVFPARVTDLGMFIIKNSGVKSISFAGGSTLTSIPEYAFSDCPALIEVRIPASVETIGGWAFGYSDPTDGLTSVIFEGNSLKTIGGNSFKNNSSLKNISLPDGLETIGAGAFKGTSISAVTIPGSVTEIGSEAFKCSSNILIHYFGSEEKWGDVHKDDGWTYNPDGVHFIVLRNMRATPDLDGGRMYACTTEGCDVRGDIIEKISRPFDFKLSKTSYTFDGTAKKPSVTEVKDEEGSLIDAADYKVSYSNNVKAGKTARVIVTFDSEKYSGSKTIYFTINKAANTFKIKAKTATVKYKKLRKKTQAIKVASVIRFVNKGQGAKTYVRVSGNKKISVNKKTGKVTIKKGLKKGKYKVKVKVKAAGDANYKASAYKTVTFVIKVK